MSTTSIFFNQSFDKKKLKTFIYWVLKTFGEKKALTIVEELKRMGFSNATKAGLSIGLHDLKTPLKKRSLISRAQITMNKTDREFQGAELTATERSQRIVDTWHRTSEDLRKQVVDYFSMYDQLNSVYMMASSGARGNFSQVRQLIGMRGLMADPQGQIISFPIRSNLREGLTLTEYFISCSGARKGLVDTALRTADTGYLTRRLVDISHHIVVKKVTCYTSRGIALKTLRTSQKVLLPLKDRLVGRVLGENIYDEREKKRIFASPLHLPDFPSLPMKEQSSLPIHWIGRADPVDRFAKAELLQPKLRFAKLGQLHLKAKLLHRQRSLINTNPLLNKTSLLQGFVMQKPNFCKHKHEMEQNSVVFQELGHDNKTSVMLLPQRTSPFQKQRVGSKGLDDISFVTSSQLSNVKNSGLIAKKNQEISPDLAFKISLIKANPSSEFATKNRKSAEKSIATKIKSDLTNSAENTLQIQQDLSSSCVLVRSPLTCAYTHEVCQLCYGWSMAQGSLVSLGEAVGVIAGQSIGEPGTQLTMRTFHTGGVFSGDLLQEIRAPHSGKIVFPQALQGLLIRTSQGKIAFLIKVSGELLIDNNDDESIASAKINDFSPNEVVPKIKHKITKISLEPSTILFVRQGQKVQNNQILAELAITSEEGNQPVKSRQTLFSEITGRIIQWKSLLSRPLGKTSKNICNFIVTPKIAKDKKKLATQKTSDTKNKLFKNEILQKRSLYKSSAFIRTQKQSFYPQEIFPTMQKISSSGTYSLRLKYDSQNRSDVDHNFLLKQIVLSKKHGFGCIEPPKALQLGLLSVIATRVGASESLSTTAKKQSIISNIAHSKEQAKIDLRNHLISLPHLNTIAEQGDLVDENYIQM